MGKFANDTKLIVVTDTRERMDVIQIDLDRLETRAHVNIIKSQTMVQTTQ